MSDYIIINEEKKKRIRVGTFFECQRRSDEFLKKLSERPKATIKEEAEKEIMMAKAAEFVENGIPFEMAPKELQDHHFFKVGYEVALRRKKALEMQGNKKIGGR